MKKLLFLCYGGGHVNCLIPIIKHLKKDNIGRYIISAIGINLAAETFMQNGIPCHSLSHYIDSPDILETGMKYANQYHDFSSSVAYVDSCAYYGFSVTDLCNFLGNKVAQKVIEVYGRRLFLPIESMKHILRKENPDLVIVTSMHRFESAAIIAANELGIKSLRIEDVLGNVLVPFPDKIQVDSETEKVELVHKGIQADKIILKSELEDPKLKKYVDYIYDQYIHINPTAFAVLCEKAKNNIVSRGIDERKVFITGHPSFDDLNKVTADEGREALSGFRTNDDDIIVTFMSQPLPTREKTLKALVNQLKEKNNYRLIIKLHPNEDGLIQNEILKELRYNALVIKTPSAATIALASDVVITMTSTTGLEAAYLKRPIITLGLNNEADFLGIEEMGIGYHVTDESMIIPTIEKYLNNEPSAQQIAKKQSQFAENKSAVSNICDLINDLCDEQ